MTPHYWEEPNKLPKIQACQRYQYKKQPKQTLSRRRWEKGKRIKNKTSKTVRADENIYFVLKERKEEEVGDESAEFSSGQELHFFQHERREQKMAGIQ